MAPQKLSKERFLRKTGTALRRSSILRLFWERRNKLLGATAGERCQPPESWLLAFHKALRLAASRGRKTSNRVRENQVPGLVKAAETGPRVEASTDGGRQRQTPRGLTLRTALGTHTAGRPLGTEKSPAGGGCFQKQPGGPAWSWRRNGSPRASWQSTRGGWEGRGGAGRRHFPAPPAPKRLRGPPGTLDGDWEPKGKGGRGRKSICRAGIAIGFGKVCPWHGRVKDHKQAVLPGALSLHLHWG